MTKIFLELKKSIFPFLISALIVFLAAFIGSFFTTPNISNWYQYLNKPSFNPPNWVFGPTWTILYLLMAAAAFLIWQKRNHPQAKKALIFYLIQLGLNSLWSIIFFGFHQIGLAFIEIIILWFFILLTLLNFYKISKPAGALLIPYLLWVSFASFLNFSLWLIN